MFHCNCEGRLSCTGLAAIASLIVGVLAAFLQIGGVFVLSPVFAAVAFAIAVVYLGVLVLAAALTRRTNDCCGRLTTVLIGILGTVLVAAVLLAVGIVATSIISAILVGVLLFFFALTLTGTACYVRCLADCQA